jgi:HicB family
MSRLTLRLPETLHQQLINLAQKEGISLNQYIVYALTRQVSSNYTIELVPQAELEQQQMAFANLLAQLGQADTTESRNILSKRDVVEAEPELTQYLVARLKSKIEKAFDTEREQGTEINQN